MATLPLWRARLRRNQREFDVSLLRINRILNLSCTVANRRAIGDSPKTKMEQKLYRGCQERHFRQNQLLGGAGKLARNTSHSKEIRHEDRAKGSLVQSRVAFDRSVAFTSRIYRTVITTVLMSAMYDVRADYKYADHPTAKPLLQALFSKLPGRRATAHIPTKHTHAPRRLSLSHRRACVRGLTHTRHTCPGSHVRSHVHRIHLPPQRNAQFHVNLGGAPSTLQEGPTSRGGRPSSSPLLSLLPFRGCLRDPPSPVQYRGAACRARRAE